MILAAALILSVFGLMGVIVGIRSEAATSAEPVVTNEDLMRARILELRGIIDRAAMKQWFLYPTQASVRPSGALAKDLGDDSWPADPWTGKALTPGTERGNYRYLPSTDRRSYRLVGYLGSEEYEVSGGMPHQMMVAYDHRGEEGLHLIRQYVELWIRENGGVCPEPSEVFHGGDVGRHGKLYWPSNPWDHYDMKQRSDRGSFAYTVAADRRSYTLRLHRALKKDYVLTGPMAAAP